MDTPIARLETVGGRPVMHFERLLRHPPEKVWKAVTDPAEMAAWFPATVRTELEVGAPMRFGFDGHFDLGEEFGEGEILELDPPKVYAFRWFDAVLRFELVPEEPGCRLVFRYAMSDGGTWGDVRSLSRTAPGWDVCLDTLVAGLDGGPPLQPGQAWVLERAERYVEALGLAEGELREEPGGAVVRFERDLVQDNETVWSFLAGDDEVTIGGPVPVGFTHGYTPAGAVTAVEAGRVMEYAGGDGRVRFELRAQKPIGTRLVVTQTRPIGPATALAAWQTHLELLFAALHGDVRCPWPADRTEALEKLYGERLDRA